MKRFVIPAMLLLSFSSLAGEEVREVSDVIKWSDFQGSGTEDFYIGEAHYTLQYYIREKPDDNVPSFFFYNPDFLGGLLISTDRSEVTRLEVKWNDTDWDYTKDMWMYVTGNNTPWESIKAVMDAKPENLLVGKFRYYAYDAYRDIYGPEPETVVIPEQKYKHYAITPGYIGDSQVENYVLEFIITRSITVDTEKGYSQVTDLDPENDNRHRFILSTASGTLLKMEEGSPVVSHIDVTTDNEIYDNGTAMTDFVLNSTSDGKFQLQDYQSGKYLMTDANGKVNLTETPQEFILDGGMLRDAADNRYLGYDGTAFVKVTSPETRAEAQADPVFLYRSLAVDVPTNAIVINEDTDSTAPVEYFTLQGVSLQTSPSLPGIYLRRKGNEVTKIVIGR